MIISFNLFLSLALATILVSKNSLEGDIAKFYGLKLYEFPSQPLDAKGLFRQINKVFGNQAPRLRNLFLQTFGMNLDYLKFLNCYDDDGKVLGGQVVDGQINLGPCISVKEEQSVTHWIRTNGLKLALGLYGLQIPLVWNNWSSKSLTEETEKEFAILLWWQGMIESDQLKIFLQNSPSKGTFEVFHQLLDEIYAQADEEMLPGLWNLTQDLWRLRLALAFPRSLTIGKRELSRKAYSCPDPQTIISMESEDDWRSGNPTWKCTSRLGRVDLNPSDLWHTEGVLEESAIVNFIEAKADKFGLGFVPPATYLTALMVKGVDIDYSRMKFTVNALLKVKRDMTAVKCLDKIFFTPSVHLNCMITRLSLVIELNLFGYLCLVLDDQCMNIPFGLAAQKVIAAIANQKLTPDRLKRILMKNPKDSITYHISQILKSILQVRLVNPIGAVRDYKGIEPLDDLMKRLPPNGSRFKAMNTFAIMEKLGKKGMMGQMYLTEHNPHSIAVRLGQYEEEDVGILTDYIDYAPGLNKLLKAYFKKFGLSQIPLNVIPAELRQAYEALSAEQRENESLASLLAPYLSEYRFNHPRHLKADVPLNGVEPALFRCQLLCLVHAGLSREKLLELISVRDGADPPPMENLKVAIQMCERQDTFYQTSCTIAILKKVAAQIKSRNSRFNTLDYVHEFLKFAMAFNFVWLRDNAKGFLSLEDQWDQVWNDFSLAFLVVNEKKPRIIKRSSQFSFEKKPFFELLFRKYGVTRIKRVVARDFNLQNQYKNYTPADVFYLEAFAGRAVSLEYRFWQYAKPKNLSAEEDYLWNLFVLRHSADPWQGIGLQHFFGIPFGTYEPNRMIVESAKFPPGSKTTTATLPAMPSASAANPSQTGPSLATMAAKEMGLVPAEGGQLPFLLVVQKEELPPKQCSFHGAKINLPLSLLKKLTEKNVKAPYLFNLNGKMIVAVADFDQPDEMVWLPPWIRRKLNLEDDYLLSVTAVKQPPTGVSIKLQPTSDNFFSAGEQIKSQLEQAIVADHPLLSVGQVIPAGGFELKVIAITPDTHPLHAIYTVDTNLEVEFIDSLNQPRGLAAKKEQDDPKEVEQSELDSVEALSSSESEEEADKGYTLGSLQELIEKGK